MSSPRYRTAVTPNLSETTFVFPPSQDPYVASQGTAIGRQGRVYVSRDHTGQIWVGGATVSCVTGSAEL